MKDTISEKDWKYLRHIQPEMLASLCNRINQEAMGILRSGDGSEQEKYQRLYQHIHDSDKIIAVCFNDWRRSTIGQRIIHLNSHGLLTQEHFQHLTEETRAFIKWSETLWKRKE